MAIIVVRTTEKWYLLAEQVTACSENSTEVVSQGVSCQQWSFNQRTMMRKNPGGRVTGGGAEELEVKERS